MCNVILSRRSLRSEEPVPSLSREIWASRAMCRVLCDTIIARLARFLTKLHHYRIFPDVTKVKIMKTKSGARIHKLLLAVLLLLPASLLAEPITLHRALELALKHATGVGIAAADEQHASASYRVLRNSYIPQLNAGAGIGWSDGFPLSLEGAAPSLFNVTAQSALINPALKDFIRAAQSDVAVSSLHTKDQRNRSEERRVGKECRSRWSPYH